MKAQTVLFRSRVNQKRFTDASVILDKLGLSAEDVFEALLAQIVLRRRLPFSIALDDDASKNSTSLLTAQEQGRIWEESLGEY
jgi:antitoxin component of RelBE/YafQ-DinJ toxin-antitoxin module